MTLQVRGKKPLKSVIALNTEDVKNAQYIGNNTGDNCIKVEMPFNNLMIPFFLIQHY